MKIKINENLSEQQAKTLVIDKMKKHEINKLGGNRERIICVEGRINDDYFVVNFMPIGFNVRKATDEEIYNYIWN